MVGGFARGTRAGIHLAYDRELTFGTPELAVHQAHPIDYPKAVAAEHAWLSQSSPVPRRRPLEAMRRAKGASVVRGQVATGNVKHSIAVQIAVRIPQSAEGDPLGMAQQPGGLVVERGHPFI
jgi:hypothetical protein